ncbi:MAG: DNA polymerase III subunit alpha [Gammaproteobacteria bacterium]|nr:DNA polymerase III subunit alpha [Gammaproteobacteria bacterium]
MTSPFVHLRVHSEFSLADGIVRTPDLAAAAATAGMPAVALTDLANVFGAAKFYQDAVAAGVKPIIGADLWLTHTDPHKPHRLTLLCQNLDGYRNLSRLITRSYREGQQTGRACVAREWLDDATDGLIALSGAHEGELGIALLGANRATVGDLAVAYQRWFPNRFYIELQRTAQSRQEEYNHAAVAFAADAGLPVVATNPVMFLKREEFEAHEVRVCIQEGRVLSDSRRPRRFTPNQYFKSAAEMQQLFADVPEALANTVEIARRCNYRLEFGKYYLPKFEAAGSSGGEDVNDVLRRNSYEGLAQRMASMADAERAAKLSSYQERLDLEIGVIAKMGFAGYFLIVADFIQWAKSNGIPVGPGRGSGAGSLVAYAIGITELDPIQYELLFERFLNPERVSLPDFDIDFCVERRDEVIEYVKQRYGADKVAQIITHGTMAARAVVRDVGRVLSQSYGFCDKLAKLIPFEIGMTLDRALEVEPLLKERYDKEEDVQSLLDTARMLEGLARNAGKHAGGVVIAPSPLTDFMPLYCEQGGHEAVTQFDMEDLEKLGLVKFDFLGLRTLTIIDKAVKLINRERAKIGEAPVVIDQLPIDDPATYALLKSCKTTATFQLESRGMKDLINRLKPDQFEEIVALVALFRPGPLQSGMVDDYINRKHKRVAVKYPHPSLEPILKPTYGVILYQEQVMQIAQVLSGYSLGGADLLRRAMGKKKPEEMAMQRESFVDGARDRGVDPKLAAEIFDLIEKFAGYGFNRSHSAAYALIAYQTAWLKAHYPAAFMAAVLSSDMDKTDKVVTMTAECRDMKLKVLPPDINRCEFEFVPIDDKTVLYGLGAIKGLGESAIDSILHVRNSNGPFRDLFDFCQRIDSRKVNRRVLESLINAGALDGLGTHRAALIASLTKALAEADQHGRNREAGQVDIFGGDAPPLESPTYEVVPEWTEEQRLDGEKETLGLYLTGHPIARYSDELKHFTSATIAELKPTADRAVVVAGLVVAMRAMQTKRGDRMAFITLDDRTGRLELAVFSELFERYRALLVKDTLLVVEGHVSVDEYTGGFKMSAEKIYNIDQARAAFGSRLVIHVDAAKAANGFMDELKEILAPSQGPCPVWLRYRSDIAEADIVLGEEWRINPNAAVLERLTRLAGNNNVRLEYR